MSSGENKTTKSADKQKRLSEALRANLRRRKDQNRGRKQNPSFNEQNKAKNES